MSARRRGTWLAAVILVAFCAAPACATAALMLAPGDTTLAILDAAGEPDTRAGAHPDHLVQGFKFSESGGEKEYPRDMVVELPPGLSGDPNAVPLCPHSQIFQFGECPPESQIGTVNINGNAESTALYSVEPGPNQAAVFAGLPHKAPPVVFVGHLRPTDQGLSLSVEDIGHSPYFNLREGKIELWGVPADHQQGTSIPRKPLLTTPTRCQAGPLKATVAIRTWEHPETLVSGSGGTGRSLVGCAALSFDPSVAFTLDNPTADSTTGAEIDLSVPQNDDASGRATSQVKSVNVLLPEGMTVSPGGAAGLQSCTDAQLGLGTDAEPSCPAASRVGTVELEIASLSKPMTGVIYLGQEQPGERFRLFAVASGSGSQVKFVGSLRSDPRTGQLTTSLNNLPQASFGRLRLHFDGGPNGLLATPLGCGRVPTAATVVPYSGAIPTQWTGSVSVSGSQGSACTGAMPFAPTFTGGSTSAGAGRATSFTATVHRGDGEQLPERLTLTFPPGMSAALGTVTPCPTAVLSSGACPAGSRLGSTVAELGPGANPALINGEIFLTGPYRQAPFGLALVFKAALGPFNLGTLVVRGSLDLDPLTGQVTVHTDALPTILEGIPIRFQTIGLDLSRPGFMHNPTSCAPASVSATLRSDHGVMAHPSSPFAVRGCIDLPFHPAFSLALNDRPELHREGRPGLLISVKVPAGDANLRRAELSFPGLLGFSPNGLRAICARGQAAAGNCPSGSRVGSGYARTPLLTGPMTGPIYVVQPRGSGSPELWTSLKGNGLEVSIRAETGVDHGHSETRLVDIPDFPLKSFAMRLSGGKHGLLKLKEDPCAKGRKMLATTALAGQNGVRSTLRTRLAVQGDCGRDG